MATITLSIPDELREKMRSLEHVNWSAVARQAVTQHIKEHERREKLKQLVKEQEDLEWAVEMGRALKKGRAKQLREQGLIE